MACPNVAFLVKTTIFLERSVGKWPKRGVYLVRGTGEAPSGKSGGNWRPKKEEGKRKKWKEKERKEKKNTQKTG